MNCPFLSLGRRLKIGCLHLLIWVAPVLLNAAFLPNDPLLDQQDILFGNRGGLHLPEAWEIANSQGELDEVVVAVLSSGIRTTHEDLKNRLWINEDEIPENGIDDDGNGYVDDVHGWNFYHNNGNIEDTYGLGTFISGIIAAEQNNGLGMAGIAPNARIMSLVNLHGNGTFVDSHGYGYKKINYEMIQYAIKNGADIILTENQDEGMIPELNELPQEFIESGAILISIRLPEDNSFSLMNSPQLINVVSLQKDSRWYYPYSTMAFMGYNSRLLECASNPTEVYGPDFSTDDGYILEHRASPVAIAGIISLIKGRYPDEDPARIYSRLMQGVIEDPRLEGVIASGGYLDAELALSANVEKGYQVIHAAEPRNFNVEEGWVNPQITASSGLAVDLEILEGPVVMEDGRLKMTGNTGLVRLRATQEGNDDLDPAEPFEIKFHITESIRILQPESDSKNLTQSLFGNNTGSHLHIDGDTLVASKTTAASQSDPRIAVIGKRDGIYWPVTGYLNFPTEDVEAFSDGFRSAAYVNDDWIFVSADARDYYQGPNPARTQLIYVYKLNEASGEYELHQSMEEYCRDKLCAKGRWMAYSTTSLSAGLTCILYRRDDSGYYQKVDFPPGLGIYHFHLGEDHILLEPNLSNSPFQLYELGDHAEPVFLQEIPRTVESAIATFDGDWLAIGDANNSDRMPHAGAIQIYHKNEENQFEWTQTLYADNANLAQSMGEYAERDSTMALDNGILAVSAARRYDQPGVYDSQYIYFLDEATGHWKQRYRTEIRESLLPWNKDTYRIYLDDGWLTCLSRFSEYLSFDLNNPRRLPQDLYFTNEVGPVYVDQEPFELEIATDGEGAVQLEVVSGPATVEGQSIVLEGEAGEVVIAARQQETWRHDPSATQQMAFSVKRYDQELSIAPYEVPRYADTVLPFTVSASSGLEVQNQLLEGSGMFFQDGLHIFEGGNFTVEFSQEGNWKFNPAEPVTVSFQIREDWLKLFDEWAQLQGYTGADAEPEADPDKDGISLMQNFLFAGDPANGIPMYFPRVKISNRYYETTVQFRVLKGGPGFLLQKSVGNPAGPWTTVFEVDPEYDGIPSKIFEQKILLQRTAQPSFLRVVAQP